MSSVMKRAGEAIDRVYSDTAVPIEETAARMKSLRLKIEEYLDTLREDGVNMSEIYPSDDEI